MTIAKMDNITQLFIRACKSKHPRIRILSVYKRFYYHKHNGQEKILIGILSNIYDKYLPKVSIKTVLEDLAPYQYKFAKINYDYHSAALNFLITKIKLANTGYFPGLTKPLSLRKEIITEIINLK